MSKAVRLLVVEDSEDDTKLAVLALRRGGFDPTYRRVQDFDALRSALSDERWDAVLSDFSMPGFTGADALKVFRSAGLDIPFIFVSGTIGEEAAVAAMKAGASDYVMKQNLTRLAPVLERELTQAWVRTQHHQAEVDLQKSEAQLRHLQKLESIGTLAGGIAHDFNNILGAILGNVALAREDVIEGQEPSALGHLEEIRKSGLRARDLVRQILTFSRRLPQELLTQPLQPIVEEAHMLLRATLPSRVALNVALTAAPLRVHADSTQLQQVLMNLCTNAWHALKDGSGRITISLDGVLLDEASSKRLGGVPCGSYAHLSVADTGIGIDAATRERIFEPFFTTKPVGLGTGLGLSVVHGIVAAHHGAIAVDSEPGLGSTFHVYLPAVEEEAAVPAGTASPVAAHGNGEHVLYVDDEEAMVMVVEHILRRAGYRVSAFLGAQDAIAAVRADPKSFDLVVTDYNMPQCSGLEVARELARIRADLPVVISSGYITEELHADARSIGVRGLIEKQNNFEELGGLVARILAQRAQ